MSEKQPVTHDPRQIKELAEQHGLAEISVAQWLAAFDSCGDLEMPEVNVGLSKLKKNLTTGNPNGVNYQRNKRGR